MINTDVHTLQPGNTQQPDPTPNLFHRLTNIRPLLDALSQGSVIRQTVGTLVQCFAVLLTLYFIFFWGITWAVATEASFLEGLGLIIWQVTSPFASYLVVKLFFIRGQDIKQLPDSDFTVAPIIATLLSMVGEAAFLYCAAISVPAMFVLWWAAGAFSYAFPIAPVEGGFLLGIGMFFLYWILGFFFLLFTRGLREFTMAIFTIAHDVNVLRRHSTNSIQDETN